MDIVFLFLDYYMLGNIAYILVKFFFKNKPDKYLKNHQSNKDIAEGKPIPSLPGSHWDAGSITKQDKIRKDIKKWNAGGLATAPKPQAFVASSELKEMNKELEKYKEMVKEVENGEFMFPLNVMTPEAQELVKAKQAFLHLYDIVEEDALFLRNPYQFINTGNSFENENTYTSYNP